MKSRILLICYCVFCVIWQSSVWELELITWWIYLSNYIFKWSTPCCWGNVKIILQLFVSIFAKHPRAFPMISHTQKGVFVVIVMLANHQSFSVLPLQIGSAENVILLSSGLVQIQLCNWCGQWWSLNKIFSVHYLLLLPVSSACVWLVEYSAM